MGIMNETKEYPAGDLEMVDHTSSSGGDESFAAIEEHHVDGVWVDDENKNRESYYSRGDRLRFAFLVVLMTTLIVTIISRIAINRKNPSNDNLSKDPAPTISPRPSPAPTTSLAPTVDPERAQNIAAYINSITLTQRVLVYPSEDSTEEKALKWVIEDDPARREFPLESLSIRARYALALLWFQSDDHFTDNQYEGYYSDYNYTSSWLTEHYECEWTGITCAEVDDGEGYGSDLITDILLYNSSVHGVLSPDIALVTSLVRLQLHVNSISSPVPWTLATLPYLRNLDLGDNNFSEPVPEMIGSITSLVYLSLAGNNFYGTVPQTYRNLVNLTDLLLYNNSGMDGPLPDVSQSTNLEQLVLYNNSFTGTLPGSLFHMKDLYNLDVSGNSELTGLVAPTNATEFYSPLRTLNLHSTNLNGTLVNFCENVFYDGNGTTNEFTVDAEDIDCPCCTFFCPWPNETVWAPNVECDA